MRNLAVFVMLVGLASPVFAEGDVANGEAQFSRQCVACHVVRDNDGDVLAGRTAKAGPNLYNFADSVVGTVDGFRYGDSIVQAGEAGATWTQENFVAYIQNPTDWLRETLDNRRARSKMGYKVRSDKEAADIYAYLATFSE